MSHDLVVRGGLVIDGSSAAAPVRADVAIDGDTITAIGADVGVGRDEIDATGMVVTPGFIDVHSHDDVAVLVHRDVAFKTRQGVTTDVVGNCGFGPAPYEPAMRTFIDWHPEAESIPAWDGHGGYAAQLGDTPPALNVAFLVGHGTVRLAVIGSDDRPPTDRELGEMKQLVAEGMRAGAVGLSTGLIYRPGKYATTDEIVPLAEVAAEHGGLYASHIRNEGGGLVDAVREALEIGERSGAPVQVSHHKASGRSNWGRVRETIAMIEEARRRGLTVHADQYPYLAGCTFLAAVVDAGALDGVNGPIGTVDPADVTITSAPHDRSLDGRTLAELAEREGVPGAEMAKRIVAEHGHAVMVVINMMDEDDVRTVLAHESTMIGSDGDPAGTHPHPRLYGTFARVLGRYVRDQDVLPLAQAVHRMTGLPAAAFALAGRGRLEPGAFADVVVFDPETIVDVGTYDDPCHHPEGIEAVVVNGQPVVRDGMNTDARPGRVVGPSR